MSAVDTIRATPCVIEGHVAYRVRGYPDTLAAVIEALRMHCPTVDDDFQRRGSYETQCDVWPMSSVYTHEDVAEALREACSRTGYDLVLEPVPATLAAALRDTEPPSAPAVAP